MICDRAGFLPCFFFQKMRKYLFLAYPICLYVVFSLSVVPLFALFYTCGIDLIIANSLGTLGMTLTYLFGKRKKTEGLTAVPWRSIFLLTGTMALPVVLLSLLLTIKAFGSIDLTTYLINCTWSFFCISLCEELLFREFLTVRMKTAKMPNFLILLLPALLFSLCHRPESVSFLLQRFILGTLLGYLYQKGGLALCVAVHWMYDIIIYTFHTTLPYVTTCYSAARAALHATLCLLSLFIMVVVYCLNKSKFA